MKTIKSAFTALAILLMGALLPSCNTNSGDEGVQTLLALVTFQSVSDNGSVFTYRVGPYTPEITLTSTYKLSTDRVKVGDRCLIQYRIMDGRDANTSGPIQLDATGQVLNGRILTGNKDDYADWASEDVIINTAWVSGPWLNLYVTANMLKEPKTFKIVADETTMTTETPVLHLIYESDDALGSALSAYASINIDEIWSDSSYKNFKLIYKDTKQMGFSEIEFQLREGFQPAN